MSALPKHRLSMIDPGVCRFCGNSKKCRILNMTYEYMGQKEIYSEMLMDCFGLLLSHLDGKLDDRLVCATCVVRLRACLSFKRQVMRCEEQFLQQLREAKVRSNGNSMKHEKIIEVTLQEEHAARSPFPNNDVSTSKYVKSEKPDAGSIVIETAEDSSPYDDDGHDACADSLNPLEDYVVKIEEDSANEFPAQQMSVKRETNETTSSFKVAAKTSRHSAKDNVQVRSSKEKESLWKKQQERTLRMKKLLLLKMESLKAIQAKRAAIVRPMPPSVKRMGLRKDRMMVENTCRIVECSFVCPFNNITGNFYCFYCRSIFTVPQDLREHTLTHDPKTFPRYLSKKKAVKIDLTRIDCRLCEDQINDLHDLKQHLATKHNLKIHPIENEFLRFKLTHPTLACQECGENFYFVDKLIDHMAEHFGSFICDKCGATFVQASSLEAHIRCHNETKKRFDCSYCGKSLSTNRARYVHMNTVHEKNPVIDCLKCEEKFFTYDGRNKHMVAAHGHNMSFPCNTCDKVFDTRKKFIKHNQVVHLKAYSHSCQLCERKFFTATHVKRHMKTHSNL